MPLWTQTIKIQEEKSKEKKGILFLNSQQIYQAIKLRLAGISIFISFSSYKILELKQKLRSFAIKCNYIT